MIFHISVKYFVSEHSSVFQVFISLTVWLSFVGNQSVQCCKLFLFSGSSQREGSHNSVQNDIDQNDFSHDNSEE